MDKSYGIYKYAKLGASHLVQDEREPFDLAAYEQRKLDREAEYARYRTQAEDAQDKLIKDI